MDHREKPAIIRNVGFDFNWDERKVWQLDVPVKNVPIKELTWHLSIPFLWSEPDGYYDVYPRDVIDYPGDYPEEYKRTMAADTAYPIDCMFWKERLVILDDLHRLMKQAIEGREFVKVRTIPESAIPLIQKPAVY